MDWKFAGPDRRLFLEQRESAGAGEQLIAEHLGN
jgi:hypothetical protein